MAELRSNPQALTQKLNRSTSRIFLWHQDKLIANDDHEPWFTFDSVRSHFHDQSLSIYLGSDTPNDYFALELPQLHHDFKDLKQFGLRESTSLVSEVYWELLFYSKGLINWHSSHKYCPQCGENTLLTRSGHARRCASSVCQKEHFPRIEPAAIFSIQNNTNSTSRILLARQPSWEKKRYSVIAGFVEPGENIEAAVKREAYEEVGLHVDNIRYFGSQPWPFPGSLMLGFECETNDTSIRLIDQELETAIWVDTLELEEKVKKKQLKLPYQLSISNHLIDSWYRSHTEKPLSSLFKR